MTQANRRKVTPWREWVSLWLGQHSERPVLVSSPLSPKQSHKSDCMADAVWLLFFAEG